MLKMRHDFILQKCPNFDKLKKIMLLGLIKIYKFLKEKMLSISTHENIYVPAMVLSCSSESGNSINLPDSMQQVSLLTTGLPL